MIISQGKIFDAVGFQPHDGQREILSNDNRFRVVSAGRRFGKSAIGGNELITEALKSYYQQNQLIDEGRRAEFWIVGPEYSDSEKEFRVLWNGLKKIGIPFDQPGSYNNPIGGSLHLSLWDGLFQVHGKSAKHPETLVGEGLSGVILAEAAKLKERVWTKFIRPTLSDFGGWALMTSTPEGKNWFYEAWRRGLISSGDESWSSWKMPSWCNTAIYKKKTTMKAINELYALINAGEQVTSEQLSNFDIDPEISQLIFDLSDTVFKQEICAEFTEFVGRVFKDFDEEVHVANLEFNPDYEHYGAVDYGFTNPNVWLLIQVSPFGDIHILKEYYQRGVSAREFAYDIDRLGLSRHVHEFFPDPASPGDTRELENILHIRGRRGTGGELKPRLEMIRRALKTDNLHLEKGHPHRKPKLMIDRSCVNTIREFNDYRYPQSIDERNRNSAELPMKKDDHTPEALGRFFAGYYGTDNKKKARISDAVFY